MGATGHQAARRIARPALARRLGAALRHGAVLLVAPAGSGKTMALEEALALEDAKTAWVSCAAWVKVSARDREAGRLLEHLVAVLREAAPGTADAFAERLEATFAPIDVRAAAAELAAEIGRLVVDPLTIVFDDAEHLAESVAAAGVLDALLRADAEAVRIAIATRRALPLRVAKLRAAGRITEFSAAELAFTADEAAELIALRRGAGEVSDAEVDAAMQATEGWPLGVALRARRTPETAGAIPTRPSELRDFLVEEVLDGLEPDFRRDLVASSLPQSLDAELATALGLAPGFLEKALRRDLFLRPLAEGGRLAYHPLFREFLLGRLDEELSPEERRELHAGLATALSEERPLEAVDHWLAAGREPEAVRLIGRHSQPLVRSAPQVVRGWIDRLTPASRSEPAVQLLEAQLAMGEGRHGEVVDLLAEAAEEWERRGSRAMWTARFALAQAFIVLGRFDEVPALAEGFDETETAGVVAAAMVGLWAAVAVGGTGRREEGRALLERARAHPLGALVEPIAVAFEAYYVDWHEGRLDSAVERARIATARMEEFDPVRWLPFNLWYAALVHEARGEDEEAVRLVERAREVTREYGIGEYPAAVAGAMKAGWDARAGRLADAEVEIARSAPHLGGNWHGYDLELARAEIAARRGDREQALAAAERAHALAARGYLGERLRAAMLLAPLLEGLGAAPRARSVLDAALAARTPGTRAPRLLAQRAWLRDLEGDPGALEDLAAAWEDAGDQAAYLVRGEWRRVERLVWRALEEGVLEPEAVVEAVGRGLPRGDALVALSRHPVPGARRAAAAAVATSGHPEAPARLEELAADDDAAVVAAAERAVARLRREPPALAFTLFGAFGLRRGGRVVEEEAWERRVAERLVRFLLVHEGQVVPEDVIFEAFWPERPPGSARRSLQVAVSCARAVLEPPGAASSVLEVRERSYRLALREGDTVDTALFTQAAQAALADESPERPAVLRRAAALWGGEPLPEDRYEGWSAAWRERLVDLYAEVLAALAQACFASDDPFGATAAARRLVELDPVSETAHRTLMVAFARSGRRGHALRQYLDCRRLLLDELGLEPAAETATLHRAILAGDAV